MSWSSAPEQEQPVATAEEAPDAAKSKPNAGKGGLRQLGKQSLVYGAGVILGKLAGFIMLPIYTRYLTPADYGLLELMAMTIDVIGMVAGIGLASSIFKFYADAGGESEKKQVIGTAAISAVALATLAASAGLLLSPLLARYVVGEYGSATFFRLYFLIYLLQNFSYVPLMLMRATNQAGLFVAANVAKLVSSLSLNILFVVHLEMGVMGVLTSSLITEGASALMLSIYLLRRAGLGFSAPKFLAMARFGNPMIVWSLCNFVLIFSDRLFLNHYTSTSAVGVYSLAYKFAFVLTALAYTPFRQVWEPQRFEIAKRADAQEVYARAFVYMNLTVGLAALGIMLFVEDLLRVMSDPAFHSAYQVVPLLLAAQITFLWVNFCNLGLFLKSKTGTMAVVGVAGAVVTILLNMLLIPRFGIHGAAIATLLAYAARFGWLYAASQRLYPIQYRWSPVVRLYSIIAAAVLVRLVIHPSGIGASVAWSALLLLFAVWAVYRTVLGPTEYRMVRSAMARIGFGRFLPTGA